MGKYKRYRQKVLSIFLKPHYGAAKLSAIQIIRDPMLFLAFGFGSGLSRYMPGTIGTLAAVPVYWLLIQFDNIIYSALTILSIIVGIKLCDYAASKLKVHDFGGIVWDEVAGFLITMWLVPFSWINVVYGFILFRFFDIIKPWPIKWIDHHVHGGFGIMLDDVLAGVFALICLHAALWLF
jgi:phosphatidylglycerophosphatase A